MPVVSSPSGSEPCGDRDGAQSSCDFWLFRAASHTRPNGHGFGLHSAANAAKDMNLLDAVEVAARRRKKRKNNPYEKFVRQFIVTLQMNEDSGGVIGNA
ncbi:MAG: hypothetical protein ACREF9_09330 [Opitutaceae bacterium]